MSMSWEEIAEERMKEIRRLRGVVRELEEEINNLKVSTSSLESSFTLMDIADRLNVLGYEPSDGKCRIVDKYITENFDADIGVNWSAIDKAIIQCKDKL
ncbi:MAG: hypothetical protein LRY50_13885 [Geovibrio sp.]|nr:hypothetical protein [Geovibrio sp.]